MTEEISNRTELLLCLPPVGHFVDKWHAAVANVAACLVCVCAIVLTGDTYRRHLQIQRAKKNALRVKETNKRHKQGSSFVMSTSVSDIESLSGSVTNAVASATTLWSRVMGRFSRLFFHHNNESSSDETSTSEEPERKKNWKSPVGEWILSNNEKRVPSGQEKISQQPSSEGKSIQ